MPSVDLKRYADLAAEYVAKAEAVTAVMRVAASSVAEAVKDLAAHEQADIAALLTGNPIADRARLETAAAAGVINARIDWGQVPAKVLELAKLAIDLAVFGAALL